jgi:hypothetical protein
MWNASSRSSTESRQAGQATVEFALTLIFVIVMLSALYQALHFELDAFNRISLLRYRVMGEAHANQPDEPKSFPTELMEFRPLYELSPVLLMTQTIDDPTLQYGPKKFRFRKGTHYTEPLPISALPDSSLLLGGMIISGITGTNEYKEDSRRFRDNIRDTSPAWIAGYLLDD